jgi:hypothetical protein
LLRILPVVEGTVPPANVIAAVIAMEFASDVTVRRWQGYAGKRGPVVEGRDATE